jgi:hypothetical protein
MRRICGITSLSLLGDSDLSGCMSVIICLSSSHVSALLSPWLPPSIINLPVILRTFRNINQPLGFNTSLTVASLLRHVRPMTTLTAKRSNLVRVRLCDVVKLATPRAAMLNGVGHLLPFFAASFFVSYPPSPTTQPDNEQDDTESDCQALHKAAQLRRQ